MDIANRFIRWIRENISIPLLITFYLFIYKRSRAASIARLDDLEMLSLNGIERLLIFAPHPDDEVLGAGGLIQVAQESGVEVRIVVITNGDGQRLAPMALSQRIRLRDTDFIALGERRQLEAVAALEKLGLDPECLTFLGYPDRSLNKLWLNDWREEIPFRSGYTRAESSPYTTTYNPESRYLGRHLLQDLQTLLSEYRPDFIVTPHPNDDHPDHRATAAFVRMAVHLLAHNDSQYQPQIWAYLIHYGYYPPTNGSQVRKTLLPPTQLSGEQNQWVRLDLNAKQVENKHQAIKQHATQVLLLGNFLSRFARSNELFAALPTVEVSPISLSAVPLLDTGVKEIPTIPEIEQETPRKLMMGGADLLGWRVTRLGNTLLLTVDTRGQIGSKLHYRILLKFSDGSTRLLTSRIPEVNMKSTSITTKIDLSEISDPPLLAFAADVSQGVTLDRTGWYFVHLHGWLD